MRSAATRVRRLVGLADALHDNARRAGETVIAASQTIARRQVILAEAATDPAALAHPELGRMVTEKLAAAAEATLATLAQAQVPTAAIDRWLRTQGEIALLAWREAARLSMTPHSLGLWMMLTQRSMESGAVLAEAMTGVGAAVFRAGLDPFHRATSANARRLNGD